MLVEPKMQSSRNGEALRTDSRNNWSTDEQRYEPGTRFPGPDTAGSREEQLLIPPLLPKLGFNDSQFWLQTNQVKFPLSPDHHLITLIQYNVKRALLANMAIIGVLDMVHTTKHAIFSLPALPTLPTALPPSLTPTMLQRIYPHNPLIASVPSPSMRDNLIMYAGHYDLDEMAAAIYGGLFEGFSDDENHGVMVWGDPWRADSWEISDGFAKKWGFLFKNCADLQDATNRWRASRGEKRLVIES
jgi:hypothetical protein